MHFAGWSQPLENHMAALERSGFAVTALREPIPDDSEAVDSIWSGGAGFLCSFG